MPPSPLALRRSASGSKKAGAEATLGPDPMTTPGKPAVARTWPPTEVVAPIARGGEGPRCAELGEPSPPAQNQQQQYHRNRRGRGDRRLSRP